MTKEQYYEVCEALGNTPKEGEIPVEFEDFPFEIQEALKIFNQLSDNWEAFSGTYLGKDYTLLPFLVDLYQIEDVHNLFLFLRVAESTLSEIYSNDIKMRRKAKEQAKSKTVRR